MSLRDVATDFEDLGVRVLAISRDDVRAQKAFAETEQVGYALLADPDGSVVHKYDVAWGDKPFARRVTFLVDDEQRIRHIDRNVDVTTHGKDLVDVVRRIRSEGGGAKRDF